MSPLSLLGLLMNVILILAITGLFANAGKLFGPKPVHQGDAEMPYETGMPPIAPAYDRMSVLYWRFAVLFVVFDVDMAFFLPWALSKPALTMGSMLAISGFTGMLLLMLAYFWRKGALECR